MTHFIHFKIFSSNLALCHVVGLSQAFIVINIGFEIPLLGVRAIPSIFLTPIGNPKFQNTQIPILSTDLEPAEKTDN